MFQRRVSSEGTGSSWYTGREGKKPLADLSELTASTRSAGRRPPWRPRRPAGAAGGAGVVHVHEGTPVAHDLFDVGAGVDALTAAPELGAGDDEADVLPRCTPASLRASSMASLAIAVHGFSGNLPQGCSPTPMIAISSTGQTALNFQAMISSSFLLV